MDKTRKCSLEQIQFSVSMQVKKAQGRKEDLVMKIRKRGDRKGGPGAGDVRVPQRKVLDVKISGKIHTYRSQK